MSGLPTYTDNSSLLHGRFEDIGCMDTSPAGDILYVSGKLEFEDPSKSCPIVIIDLHEEEIIGSPSLSPKRRIIRNRE